MMKPDESNASVVVIEHVDQLRDLLVAREIGKMLVLRGLSLPGANLRHAHLEGVDLSASDLSGAHFGRANMRGATLEAANLEGSDLASASLQGALLGEANLRDAMFEDADLEGAILRFANARGGFFENANLERADLHGADLRDADFAGANLRGAVLEHANLEGANLEGADLTGAVLVNARLAGANLHAACLEHAVVRRTNFNGATLSDASLSGLDLSSCDITHVKLARARLDKAKLAQGQLGGAIGEELAREYGEATRGYFVLERNFTELGDQPAARWAYVKRRRMQKFEALENARKARAAHDWPGALRGYGAFAGDLFVEWSCDYGESVSRVFASLFVVYLAFAALYGVTGSVVRMQGTPPVPVVTRNPFDLAIFSLLALTTSGSPGVGLQPRDETVYFLSGIQALIGIAITGLLGFVIGNRIRR